MENQDDFVPYGKEWEAGLMRMPKKRLIELLRKAYIGNQQEGVVADLERVVEKVEFEGIRKFEQYVLDALEKAVEDWKKRISHSVAYMEELEADIRYSQNDIGREHFGKSYAQCVDGFNAYTEEVFLGLINDVKITSVRTGKK